jgi:hypothetical protein
MGYQFAFEDPEVNITEEEELDEIVISYFDCGCIWATEDEQLVPYNLCPEHPGDE